MWSKKLDIKFPSNVCVLICKNSENLVIKIFQLTAKHSERHTIILYKLQIKTQSSLISSKIMFYLFSIVFFLFFYFMFFSILMKNLESQWMEKTKTSKP